MTDPSLLSVVIPVLIDWDYVFKDCIVIHALLLLN